MGSSQPLRDYPKLEIVKNGFWQHRKFPLSGFGYHEFLLTCRNRFEGVRSLEERKTRQRQQQERYPRRLSHPALRFVCGSAALRNLGGEWQHQTSDDGTALGHSQKVRSGALLSE